MADERGLFTIWEDTVDLRQLLIGVACGGVVGFASFVIALRTLTAYVPGETPGLIKGYALMAGIAGCVMVAATVATVFKPKRWLREANDGPIDRSALMRDLTLDSEEERRALATASPKLIREMQQLQIYDLFTGASQTDRR